MRTMILATVVLVLCMACVAQATENRIGVFSTPALDDLNSLRVPAAQAAETRLIAPTPGLYDVYILCINPCNDATACNISMLGGFEFNLEVPDGWFIQAATLPACVLDFNSANNSFYCAGQVPVITVGPLSTALLATVTLGCFSETPEAGYVYLAPYFAAPSIPGHMAITDADDAFSLTRVDPSRLYYDVPVLAINYFVVPTEDRAWGDVKALFR